MALTNKLTAIADAIRAKTGKSEELTLEQMVTEIEGISGGGGSEMEEQFRLFLEDDPKNPVTKLPAGLTKIRPQAFAYSNIPSISIPDGVLSIGDYAFTRCPSLKSVFIGNGLQIIDDYAFYVCHSLKTVSLPDSLQSIGLHAFYECKQIEMLSLPTGLTHVYGYAFYKCSGLKEVTFNGVPSFIAGNIFTNCSKLITINVPWAEGEVADAPWGATNATINYNYTGG